MADFEGLGIRDESEHKYKQRIRIRKFKVARRPSRIGTFFRQEAAYTRGLIAERKRRETERAKAAAQARKRRFEGSLRNVILGRQARPRHKHRRYNSYSRYARPKRKHHRKRSYGGYDFGFRF